MEFNDYTLFEKKKLAQDYIKNNYNIQNTIEELLNLDDTNTYLQMICAKKSSENINKEKDSEKREMYIEKLQKSQIIIDENTYNEIISNIVDEDLKEKLTYIKFKSALIDSLQCLTKINDKKDENIVNKAKKALKLK